MKYDVIVIGAGQAGLAVGYFLKKTGLSFLLLDQTEATGEVWRTRYDSLKLFTPRRYSALPGLEFRGDTNGYPTKDEVADYLLAYASHFQLPIQHKTKVEKLHKREDVFVVNTSTEELHAHQVIITTGPFQKPFVPKMALSKEVYQIHSSQYRNPTQLDSGSVLVVGGGNSGAQIAVELSNTGRDVFLSVGHKMKFLPQDIGNKSIFWWFDKLGVYKADVQSNIGKFIRKQPDPIFGYELKSAIKHKSVILKPRTMSSSQRSIQFEDGSELDVDHVIWSTGFTSDYSWVDIPNIFNPDGIPIHLKGVTNVAGLYFVGLPWQTSRSSALLQGVGKDSEYISKKVVDFEASKLN
ncbi:flavin-containing monooxygenase [Bacillus sp. AK128]